MFDDSERILSTDHAIEQERLLLSIAKVALEKYICVETLGGESHIANVESALDIASIRARLGDTYPSLSPAQDAATVLVFEKFYKKPHTPSHDSHSDHHHHGGNSCNKSGPFHRLLQRVEQKLLAAIGGKKGHRIVAIILRGGALLFCPGDDIAAIGLQMYGAISGHAEHAHHAEQAILPGPVVPQKATLRRRTPLSY